MIEDTETRIATGAPPAKKGIPHFLNPTSLLSSTLLGLLGALHKGIRAGLLPQLCVHLLQPLKPDLG